MSKDSLLHQFSSSIDHIDLPERFTFPFYYTPHKLAVLACEELQVHIEKESLQWTHNFGLDPSQDGLIIGKMFGVLVVKDANGKLGYLAAFSGKLNNSNFIEGFVPPIYDTLDTSGFYKIGEQELNELNKKIEILESNPVIHDLRDQQDRMEKRAEAAIKEIRAFNKSEKTRRKSLREEKNNCLTEEEYLLFDETLKKESIRQSYRLKDAIRFWEKELQCIKDKISDLQDEIDQLKENRKQKSNFLQSELHKQYVFFNGQGKKENLINIFDEYSGDFPPAGTGECAAPKLLQYAYMHECTPITMAEFWWGASPKSEIRKHKNYYPACRGKCEPVLGYMLEGITTDPNPMMKNTSAGAKIEIIFEDDYMLAINKPPEMLSVRGKNVTDSVQERMRKAYPHVDGPMIVHRLDMSTSGIMLLAKSMEVYKNLQQQFIKRSIKKRYVAMLDGEIDQQSGTIDLPLRVDLNDRPRQLVCFEHGKSALTKWEKIGVKKGKTRVYFYPHTGRTHQLRVHAAHVNGLEAPIVGDDLYGVKSNRLHLHAEQIIFKHPVSNDEMCLNVSPDF